MRRRRDSVDRLPVRTVPAAPIAATASPTWSGPRAPSGPVEVALGEIVGRYQVRRALGRGGMGQVYLARDVVLERSVALKIVSPGRCTGLSTAQCLHEARAIARLNHPHIVQLHDFGEHRGGLYIALEYVEGDTLCGAARDGLPVAEALRHARAIADGLRHAHDHGVYHCDLKPSNVMIGDDGRIRIVDFGIARTGENAASTSSGTPDWMAPEQRAGAPVTDRVDTWALGIVTAQLLTGRHPLGDEPDARRDTTGGPGPLAAWTAGRDVPPAVAELIARSLEREPTLRPSAAEWVRVLDRAIIDGCGEAITEGPYRGAAAFDEKHAGFYAGRELEIDAFVDRLRDAPHLTLAGPPGAGKSSFLHAGVIPRLRAQGAWTVIAFRPGRDPTAALARHVLAAAGDDPRATPRPNEIQRKAQVQAFRAELLETPTLLAARLATIASARGGRVLLAIDQLEDAFTRGAGETERARFLQMLASAVGDPLDPVRVVVAVRDDLAGELAGLRPLFVLRRLALDDLRRAITTPLARCDHQLDDPALVGDLLAELGGSDAPLALLQLACRALWDGRDPARRRLLRSTYREGGGLAGAIARHAEHALAELSPDERRTARRLLRSLGPRRARRGDARDPQAADTAGAGPVLEHLLAARLVVQRDPGGGAPALALAHPSLAGIASQIGRRTAPPGEPRRGAWIALGFLLAIAAFWAIAAAR